MLQNCCNKTDTAIGFKKTFEGTLLIKKIPTNVPHYTELNKTLMRHC